MNINNMRWSVTLKATCRSIVTSVLFSEIKKKNIRDGGSCTSSSPAICYLFSPVDGWNTVLHEILNASLLASTVFQDGPRHFLSLHLFSTFPVKYIVFSH